MRIRHFRSGTLGWGAMDPNLRLHLAMIRLGRPARAFPGHHYIATYPSWFWSNNRPLQPAILIHECFHYYFENMRRGHPVNVPTINPFAYQGFISVLGNLPIGPLLERQYPAEGRVENPPLIDMQPEHNVQLNINPQSRNHGGGFDAMDGLQHLNGFLIPNATKTEMEHAFGADFTTVRLHTDSRSAKISESIGARAFTYGRDIYSGANFYQPQSSKGRRLPAHELTDTIQQGAVEQQRVGQTGKGTIHSLRQHNSSSDAVLQLERSNNAPSWIEPLITRDLVRDIGSQSYNSWIRIIEGILTEPQRQRVVRWVCEDAYARAIFQGQGLRSLVALHDAYGDVNFALQLLREWRNYSPEMLTQPHRSTNVVHNENARRALARIVNSADENSWRHLVAMRRQSPEQHEAVIVAFLRMLQQQVRHGQGRGEETTGEQLRSNQSYIATGGCHDTSLIIVFGLRALGIPAQVRGVWDSIIHSPYVGGHSFPWFPTIERGFIHGDDLYNRSNVGSGQTRDSGQIRDPSQLLVTEETIETHWRTLHELEENLQRENATQLSEAMSQPSSESEEHERAELFRRLRNRANIEIRVPRQGGGPPFRFTIARILQDAPATLALAFAHSRQQHYVNCPRHEFNLLTNYFESVQNRLDDLPNRVNREDQAGEHLPEHVRHYHLPETENEAMQEVFNEMFRFTVRERARIGANAVVYGLTSSCPNTEQ